MNYSILWADDEIDLLKPLIIFLEGKGLNVHTVNSGLDAIDSVQQNSYDIIFLDENMPGMSGLEVLVEIKKQKPNLPVVMITKSEEEEIMEEAIGSKISDYLIKPINPSQLLLSVKKIMERKKLEEVHTNSNYRQEFAALSLQYQNKLTAKEWADIYNKLIFWELEIDLTENKSMAPILQDQKTEANKQFSKFIEKSYESWLNNPDSETPILSHLMMRKHVFPLLNDKSPLFFILIDNLRLDQWKILENLLSDYFQPEKEETYYSILPTTTAYARNSIFAGMMPSEIQKKYADKWVNDLGDSTDEEGFNQHEEFYLNEQLKRLKINAKTSYHKIIHQQHEKNLLDNFNNLMNNSLNVVVFNFVDMLSHSRTDMSVIKQLSPDESAYRSLTSSWFQHSALFDFLKRIYAKKGRVIITTDHGMIRVQNPVKIIGDKSTNSNLRYKHGKNLSYDQTNKIMVVKNPDAYFLPKLNMSTSYVFSREDSFLAYPNNYNHYVQHYKNTFQHGGISMEECIIPVVYLTSKK
ncbi:MAG: hypothetical protein RJA76_2157 [Bacteroidota bacterium]|jgi:DNA-binding response OmpR family regulator